MLNKIKEKYKSMIGSKENKPTVTEDDLIRTRENDDERPNESEVVYEYHIETEGKEARMEKVPVEEFINKGVPEGVSIICCSFAGIKELPEIPEGITGIICQGNKLTKLENLPSTLKLLWCYDNDIKELPDLGNLECLEAHGNNYTDQYRMFHDMRYKGRESFGEI